MGLLFFSNIWATNIYNTIIYVFLAVMFTGVAYRSSSLMLCFFDFWVSFNPGTSVHWWTPPSADPREQLPVSFPKNSKTTSTDDDIAISRFPPWNLIPVLDNIL
jgi:hypothetical protein